jgi:uncharacterized peroxidase-related enzyme
MAWIRSTPEDQADPALDPLYRAIREVSGCVTPLLQAEALHPRALELHHRLEQELLGGPSPLSRAQRQMIALAVSATNGCRYAVDHHTQALATELKDEALARQVGLDYREANLSAVDRALLDYAVALTCEPGERTVQEIERLREYGLGDEAILHATEVAAYLNFANRMALGLGVEPAR